MNKLIYKNSFIRNFSKRYFNLQKLILAYGTDLFMFSLLISSLTGTLEKIMKIEGPNYSEKC